MALPTALTGFTWPSDGVAYCGPYISSAGNVYVFGYLFSASQYKPAYWKATDPTVSFASTQIGGSSFSPVGTHISSMQVGDVIHLIHWGTNTYSYTSFNMATDTGASEVSIVTVAPVNGASAIAKRATGNDVIVFYNTNFVTNMGKNYGRVAARRIAGGTTVGAETSVGIGTAATTQQSESVDSALLASSNRVHLIWTTTNATSATASQVNGRCVKSTDNLDGTSPATASYVCHNNTIVNANPADVHHSSGQAFISSGNQIGVPVYRSSTTDVAFLLDADSDSPSLGVLAVSSGAPVTSAFGSTTACARLGGVPYDGTNKTVAWVTGAFFDPTYDKDTGAGFGTDTAIDAGATTSTQVSVNVFQRGSSVVLASVYDQSAGTWVYNEVVLRTVVAAQPPYVNPMPALIAQ